MVGFLLLNIPEILAGISISSIEVYLSNLLGLFRMQALMLVCL
jgi:hypothetical protein